MLDLGKDFDFLFQGFQVETWMGVLNDFDCIILVGSRIISELNSKGLLEGKKGLVLGVIAASESFDKDVFVKGSVFLFKAFH